MLLQLWIDDKLSSFRKKIEPKHSVYILDSKYLYSC